MTFDPDMCMVLGPNKILVGIPQPGTKGDVVRVSECAVLHIASLAPLNGRSPKAEPEAKRRRK